MDSSWLFLAIGAGCLWHGLQIVWVAPKPSQFVKDKPPVEKGSAAAFQRFWLDQYAWIGISLAVLGMLLVAGGML